MDKEICSLQAIEAVIPRWDHWDVDKDGNAQDLCSEGVLDSDRSYIEEYVCGCCGTYFMPDKRYDLESIDSAWKAAVAHLHPEKATT